MSRQRSATRYNGAYAALVKMLSSVSISAACGSVSALCHAAAASAGRKQNNGARRKNVAGSTGEALGAGRKAKTAAASRKKKKKKKNMAYHLTAVQHQQKAKACYLSALRYISQKKLGSATPLASARSKADGRRDQA